MYSVYISVSQTLVEAGPVINIFPLRDPLKYIFNLSLLYKKKVKKPI